MSQEGVKDVVKQRKNAVNNDQKQCWWNVAMVDERNAQGRHGDSSISST